MTPEKRRSYLEWLLGELHSEHADEMRTAQAKKPMTPLEYLQQFQNLDLTKPESIRGFVAVTQPIDYSPDPLPIPLGSSGSTRYVFQSKLCRLNVQEADPNSKDSYHPFIIKFESTVTSNEPDLNYGLYLGSLKSRTDSSSTSQNPFEETGFYVVRNIADKSIWVVFDYEPYDDLGERQSLATPGTISGYQFDLLQLFEGENVQDALSEGYNNQIFGKEHIQKARTVRKKLLMPKEIEVEGAGVRHRGGLLNPNLNRPGPVPGLQLNQKSSASAG